MKPFVIPDKSSIRIAILGCGNITRKHAGLIRNSGWKTELAFASRSMEKANEYKNKFHGVKAYSSYDSAIQDPANHVIMINTPPHLHFQYAKESLESGKHVIIEKPPFFNSLDFDLLGPLAEDNRLQLLVAENYFYRPLRKQLEEVLSGKSLGIPLFIHINATKKQKSKNDWREDPTLVKYGALFEGGIHWANLMNNIGLHITKVTGFRPVSESGLERSMQVVAETEEGPIINLLYSWEVDTLFFGLRLSRIMGTGGSVIFETNGIITIIRGKPFRIKFPNFSAISGFKPMWNDFLQAIISGQPPQFTWKMAQKDLWLIEQAYGINKSKQHN
ncbi:MAG TPA: Gfo/Idh/MocA family oxidoreductase [Saprospiraceae bacterium]|nr:Gfo/Idh/MocA family oxidoreductase [Saprospiraceae bacterium]